MIPLYLGDSKIFNVTVQDKSQPQNPDGSYPPFDLTGCTVRLVLYKGSKDTQVAAVNGTITGDPLDGVFSVTLDRATSAALGVGSFSARAEVRKDPDTQSTVYVDTLKVT